MAINTISSSAPFLANGTVTVTNPRPEPLLTMDQCVWPNGDDPPLSRCLLITVLDDSWNPSISEEL